MAVFQAFRALRPVGDKAGEVAALPYDVVTRQEAGEICKKNPLSFLRVDRGETDLEEDVDLYDDRVYQRAADNLQDLEAQGILVQDEKPCYYLCELTRAGRVQTGIAGCCSIDDYRSGVIRQHELTRKDKEQDRVRHVQACDAQTGPIYLACRYSDEMISFMESWKETHEAEYDFTAEDGIRHRLWVIRDEDARGQIREAFEAVSAVYIADGHHRAAAAVRVGEMKRAENPSHTGKEEYNFFLSVIFPWDQLTLLPYHRVVRDLNGLSERAFLGSMKFNFELMAMPGFPCRPVMKHTMGLYVGGEWYHLKAWPDVYENRDPIQALDVSILQDKVLSPVLGIKDPRTDERIRFLGGNVKLKDLAAAADETKGAAFAMYPVSMEELMAIADGGHIMPPKSTWFEPKLRSGLLIHKLSS